MRNFKEILRNRNKNSNICFSRFPAPFSCPKSSMVPASFRMRSRIALMVVLFPSRQKGGKGIFQGHESKTVHCGGSFPSGKADYSGGILSDEIQDCFDGGAFSGSVFSDKAYDECCMRNFKEILRNRNKNSNICYGALVFVTAN